jgi:uncharacterized membrane protein
MTGNRVDHLNKGYQGFFGGLPYVVASPYIVTAFVGGALLGQCLPHRPSNAMFVEEMIAGIGTCVVLTLIPVLPACTVLTAGIAVSGAVIAGLSALVTYPVSLALDYNDQNTVIANPALTH